MRSHFTTLRSSCDNKTDYVVNKENFCRREKNAGRARGFYLPREGDQQKPAAREASRRKWYGNVKKEMKTREVVNKDQ